MSLKWPFCPAAFSYVAVNGTEPRSHLGATKPAYEWAVTSVPLIKQDLVLNLRRRKAIALSHPVV